MKILMTGANGMLAKAVRERFKEHELILTDVVGTELSLDITNLKEVEEPKKTGRYYQLCGLYCC